MPAARQRGQHPAAGRPRARGQQRRRHRFAAGPDERQQRQDEIDPAQAVDQQERGATHPGLVQHDTRPGHDRRPHDDGQDPAVDPVRNVLGQREQPQRGRPRREEDAGGGGENHDVVADDQIDRNQLVPGVALLEDEHEEHEGHGSEDREPQDLDDRVRDHPAEELQPAERRCRRHPAREVARGAEEEPPRQETDGQDPGQPEQRQRKTPQAAPTRQALPGRVQGVGVRLRPSRPWPRACVSRRRRCRPGGRSAIPGRPPCRARPRPPGLCPPAAASACATAPCGPARRSATPCRRRPARRTAAGPARPPPRPAASWPWSVGAFGPRPSRRRAGPSPAMPRSARTVRNSDAYDLVRRRVEMSFELLRREGVWKWRTRGPAGPRCV